MFCQIQDSCARLTCWHWAVSVAKVSGKKLMPYTFLHLNWMSCTGLNSSFIRKMCVLWAHWCIGVVRAIHHSIPSPFGMNIWPTVIFGRGIPVKHFQLSSYSINVLLCGRQVFCFGLFLSPKEDAVPQWLKWADSSPLTHLNPKCSELKVLCKSSPVELCAWCLLLVLMSPPFSIPKKKNQ